MHKLTPPTTRTTVEINVAIIAASFPCLKPLFKSIFDSTSATARYGASKYKGYMRNDDPSNNRTGKSGTATAPRSQHEPEFEMYNQGKFTTDVKTGTPSMTGSEESILQQDKSNKPDGITKTSTVFVSYDRKRGSGDWAGQEGRE